MKTLNLIRSTAWKWINNKLARIIIIASLVIIAFSFFYRFVIFPYENQKTLGTCLINAKKTYLEQWMSTCRSLYSKEVFEQYGGDKLCDSMAAQHADPIQWEYYTQMSDCFEKYGH